MSTYERLAGIEFSIEDYTLEPLHQEVESGFSRVTIVMRLRGEGRDGLGEDVTYDAQDQNLHFQQGATLPLAGRHTLDSFSDLLGTFELFSETPRWTWQLPYRTWAYESAALDLALRQNGLSLAEALGIDPRPLRFAVSMGLGEPPDISPIRRWLEINPDLRFKLDANAGWTDEFCAAVAATGAVDVIDLKGHYEGADFAPDPDPLLYRRIAEAFPEAWIEDAGLTEECREALAGHEDRLTWDAPIHGVADIEALPFAPRCVNVKPSRCGTLRSLFDLYDHLNRNNIAMYGGGQFELGPGRGQIQCLASLMHPDGPNDTAPREYNAGGPRSGLPRSPIETVCAPVGFRGALDEPG